MINQNKSEIGNDMLLVSDYFYDSNIMSIEFEKRCEPYNVYATCLVDLRNINHVVVSSAYNGRDLTSAVRKQEC